MYEGIPVALLTLVALATGFLLGPWINYFLRVRSWVATLLPLGIGVIAAINAARMDGGSRSSFGQDADDVSIAMNVACGVVAASLGLALLAKLYQAAVMNTITPQERTAGVAGLRAWLSIRNIVTVVVFAAAAAALDYNFFAALILGAAVLLAYPLINTLMQSPATAATPPPQAPAEERQRVLALVEAGKISAEDGAELVAALAQSQAAGVEAPAVINGPRRVMLLGAAVVFVGFLLPWFSVNIQQAMNESMSSMQQSMPQMPGMPPGLSIPQVQPAGAIPSVTVHGGDLSYGLGWILLAAALVAAGLPFFWTLRAANALQQRNTIFASLIVGSIALLYLLSNGFGAGVSIDVGFFMAMAGYAALWFGAIRNETARHPTPQAVTAIV